MMKPLALALSLSLAFPGMSFAADLLTVVQQAIAHDANLAAANNSYRAALQAGPKARAELLPQIEGGWARTYNRIEVEDAPSALTYWQNGWKVSLSQPLFDWSKWLNYQQAGFITARGALQLANTEKDLILGVANAYFSALTAEDEINRLSAYTAMLKEYSEVLHRQKSAGEATVIDLREVQTNLEQTLLQNQQARNELLLAQIQLENLTGQPLTTLSRLAETVATPRLESDDLNAWLAQAEAHDFQVQLKQVELEIAKLEAEKAQAGHYPIVGIQATRQPTGASAYYTKPTTTSTAMLGVQIPIFSGGAITARAREAAALEDSARDEFESAKRQAVATVRDSHRRLKAGIERIGGLIRLVKTSQETLEAVRTGYRVGSRSNADVLRTADVFYTTRRDLIRTRYETVRALLNLKAATATLDIAEIARINSQLFHVSSALPRDIGKTPPAQSLGHRASLKNANETVAQNTSIAAFQTMAGQTMPVRSNSQPNDSNNPSASSLKVQTPPAGNSISPPANPLALAVKGVSPVHPSEAMARKISDGAPPLAMRHLIMVDWSQPQPTSASQVMAPGVPISLPSRKDSLSLVGPN